MLNVYASAFIVFAITAYNVNSEIVLWTCDKARTLGAYCSPNINADPGENDTINIVDYYAESIDEYDNDKVDYFGLLKNASTVPVEILARFPNALSLDLQKKGLRSIRSIKSLKTSNYRTAYLSQNYIQVIYADNFQGFPEVLDLLLNNNRISVIEDFAFRSNKKVYWIDLSDNLITTLTPYTLNGLTPNHLQLHNNKIESIDVGFLTQHHVYSEISLENNICIDKNYSHKKMTKRLEAKISKNCEHRMTLINTKF